MKPYLTSIFVGRNKEISQLIDTLATVRDGGGRCVLISGEAGIGKSRLIAEVRTRASDSGFTTLTGRCFEQDRSFPYAPLIEILHPLLSGDQVAGKLAALGLLPSELVKLLPELAGHTPPEQPAVISEAEVEKRRLFGALASLFLQQVKSRPLLLIVEDLHWSDQASLEFLLYLVRHMANTAILLLLSYRSIDPQTGVAELLAGLDREPIAKEIRLDPLTIAEVAELLKAILGQPQAPSAELVEAIYNLTEGNPFFVEEICASLIASGDIYYADKQWRRKPLSQIDIPDSIQRLVEQRLQRLSLPARRLIELAAVNGRSFDFIVLQALTKHSDSELLALVKELMAARLVVEESADQFSFRHALTREALYSQLLTRERQTLHAQIVSVIEEMHAGSLESYLEELAYHAYEARLGSKTLIYAQRAGEKALALFAPDAAAEQFTHAIQASEQLSLAPDPALYRLRGQAFDVLGDFERARQDYETALSAARAAGDQQAAWQAMIDLGLLWAARNYERSGDYCRQALDLARSMNDRPATAHSLNRLGNWLMNSGQPFEALDYHRQALNLFETLQDQDGIAATLDLLAMTSNMCGDAAGTVSYYQRAIPILRQLNNRQTLASSLTMLSNYTLKEELAREALELAREIDWRAGEAYTLTYLGSLLAMRGDYGRGLSAARSGLDLAKAIDHLQWQAWGHIILGLIDLELLAAEAAYHHFQSSRQAASQVGSSFMTSVANGFLAATCLLLDRPEEADTLIPRRLSEQFVFSDFSMVKPAVELVLTRQGPDEALRLLDRLELPDQENWLGGMAYYFGLIFLLRGEILRRLGRLEQAEAGLRSILDLCLKQGVHMGLWRVWLALGKIYRARADFERAEEAFTAARASIDELAATVSDESLRDNFRFKALEMAPAARRLSSRQVAKAEFGGLTRRERQVAAVVAQGLSNQEIANELVVSLKTVEAHVTRILSKLGFSSRAQIAVWAVDKGLASAPQDLDSLSTGD